MTLGWEWLGRQDYRHCWDMQRARRDAIVRGAADDVVWLVEHPRTITVGRRPAPGTPTPEALAQLGVAYEKVERGGLATWNGPGQLVAYPIISLPSRGFTIRAYIDRLEQTVIEWLLQLGVEAGRRPKAPGVWVGDRKVAAIGVHVRRGVTIHGVAVNIAPDLDDFSLIVPCGLEGLGVTSLAKLGVFPGTLRKLAGDFGSRLALNLATH